MKPAILFIVPADYDSLKAKGVEQMIFERDEGGFFGKVITVHPFCSKTRSIVLNECHEVHEIGFDFVPGSGRYRLLKYVQFPVHFFRIVGITVRLAKKYRINLIRANDPFWMGLFGYIGSRICNIPFCVSIHVDYDKVMELDKDISVTKVFGSYKLGKQLERFVLSKAAMVMPISETLGAKAVASGTKAEKIRVIPHGIDLSPFKLSPRHDIRHRFGIATDMKIISFVGRMSTQKYVDDMLEIARALGRRRKDFVVVVVGGGKEEGRIRAQAGADPFLANRLVFTGFQPRDVCFDVPRASAASLCLLSGFSLIEACAAARPVVAYDVEWHAEIVKNGETGFLVREGDIDAAVEALDWLLSHPAESDAIGRKARALAFERHDLAKSSATKVQWYSELLARSGHVFS
jgi:glycogen synthase